MSRVKGFLKDNAVEISLPILVLIHAWNSVAMCGRYLQHTATRGDLGLTLIGVPLVIILFFTTFYMAEKIVWRGNEVKAVVFAFLFSIVASINIYFLFSNT